MKEHFIMYSIVETASGKCVHADTEAMCIIFATLLSIGMKGNVVINLSLKKNCRQFQLSGLRKKDMSAISSVVFLSKIKEVQTEIRKLDVDMEKRSEKLAQAFMQYKEGELSKEAYIEMKDDRNSWKEFCEERKKSLEQTIRKLEKQQKEEARFLRSLLELDGTTRINAEFAEGLIESMYLYGDGKLEINFGFKGAVEHE